MTLITGAPLLFTGGYEIDFSARFRSASGAFLEFTPAVAAPNRKLWSWDGWISRVTTGYQAIFQAYYGANAGDDDGIVFDNLHRLEFWVRGQLDGRLVTTRTFGDLGVWHHIRALYDSAQGTAANRMRLWVDGVEETSFAVANYCGQNRDGAVGNNVVHRLGRRGNTGINDLYLNAILAEPRLIVGSAPAITELGEAVSGAWRPKQFAGSFGASSVAAFLEFKNPAAMGGDTSGAGNNWAPTNVLSSDRSTNTPSHPA